MSPPDTRPLGDNYPSVRIKTGEGGSTSTSVDASTNKPMPWIVLTGIIGGLGLGLSIGALVISMLFSHKIDASEDERVKDKIDIQNLKNKNDELNHRVEVAENHWRNGDTAILNLQSSVRKLEVDHARH